tara:strand:- start:113 stop:262 length:150 start_codon:yes stop_codon:yes gene_type:complete
MTRAFRCGVNTKCKACSISNIQAKRSLYIVVKEWINRRKGRNPTTIMEE